MIKANQQKRNRIVALSFVSVLLLLMYGPLAQWFDSADRALYDQLAGGRPAKVLSNAYIVSINPKLKSNAEILASYGEVLQALQYSDVGRIVLSNPPELPAADELPGWSALLASDTPVFVPQRHRFAEISGKSGVVQVSPDNDGVLRRSDLWHLNGGVMSPSLPLAIALDASATATAPRMSGSDDSVYFSNYAEVPRIEVADLLGASGNEFLRGSTVFVDSDPAIISAASVLPSGQFVTTSEIIAALLGDIENNRMIIAPSWVKAMEFLLPVLFAIVAILFMPDRNRKEIAVLTVTGLLVLLLFEALLLIGLHVRIDLGRPILMFIGVGILCASLVVNTRKITSDAFKKGSDFLAAGRLEPAFAEFRRCNPSETIAAVMYKLSLAFEQQAKPERAEAVLEWMKRTHGGSTTSDTMTRKKVSGTPQRLGRYVIEKRIGRGAMGAVYLAKDPRINRPVALKVIPIEKEFEDEELKEARLRFYREAESAGRLTHPNIITVFDAGEDKGLAYIAMEYVPGIPLRSFTDPKKLLAPKRALALAASTAEALDYAHNQGVIHRDIKPANLLYNPKEGSLKISDFGVARITDNNSTKTGIVLGTPMYMSPEQLGAENLTGLSDLFSLGVTLYELLVGEVPFRASNIAVLMTKITTEDPALVSTRRAGIPPSVDAVLAKAMAKRPTDRFSCGAEMAIALRNCARVS
ncbi:MAG: protein kinase [Gammaproteobacteria bacterium]|nr:protein kinase [Gammaproteobacteria bacterium]